MPKQSLTEASNLESTLNSFTRVDLRVVNGNVSSLYY